MTVDTEKQREQDQPRTHNGNRQDGHGNMLELAERVERHYTSPSPLATIHRPAFFPERLDRGIYGGLFLGLLLGVLFSWLLRSAIITPEGWEGLFSLVPFTFYAFWAFAGAALGLMVGGVIAILVTPAPILQEETAAVEHAAAEDGEQDVIVEGKT